MPGSHTAGDWLADREPSLARLILPVDAALLEPGGRTVGLTRPASGSCERIRPVLMRRASIDVLGEAVVVPLLDVSDDNILPACSLDVDLNLEPEAGGGGGKTGEELRFGEALADEGFWDEMFLPVACLKRKSGESVLAEVSGVLYREASVSGEVVSDGDMVSEASLGDSCDPGVLRGEYGGGGEATGSVRMSMERLHGTRSASSTIWAHLAWRIGMLRSMCLRELNRWLRRCAAHRTPLLRVVCSGMDRSMAKGGPPHRVRWRNGVGRLRMSGEGGAQGCRCYGGLLDVANGLIRISGIPQAGCEKIGGLNGMLSPSRRRGGRKDDWRIVAAIHIGSTPGRRIHRGLFAGLCHSWSRR